MVVYLRGPGGAALLLLAAAGLGLLVWGGLARPLARAVQVLLAYRKVPIYRVDTPEPRMAISFDATWGTDHTDLLLDILDRHGVKTTFFLAGYWIEKNPDYVRKIHARGHEVATHSYAHPHMTALGRDQIRADLAKNHALLRQLTGRDPELFRPPFGEYSDKVLEVAEEMGYYTIQWSIDSLDWKDVSADFMSERVLRRAGPGEIVLFHNAGKHTPQAVDRILTALAQRGIRVVPVGELIYRDNYYVEPHSGVQRRLAPPAPPPLAPAGEEGRAAPAAAGDGAIYEVPQAGPLVALAVNVDWGEEHLPAMLAALDAAGVRATFFPTARWARKFPELARTLAARGHEVGNHGLDHAHPRALGPAGLERMIDGGARVLQELTGEATWLFAPPYGETSPAVVETARDLGHYTILWTVDTLDWRRPPAAAIRRRVREGVRPGAIVLMHPTEPTVEALPGILADLREASLRAVPVGELLRAAGMAPPRLAAARP